MAYSPLEELKRVRDYYQGDKLQDRFSALITGESGAGKTYLLRTCRLPIHIDSFDPGGTKSIRDMIQTGDVIADTSYENEDPYNPTAFEKWMKDIDIRIKTKYFNMFGTYVLDSSSSWADAVMNYLLAKAGVAGDSPKWNRDYTPQKTYMINYIKRLMSLPCDFIFTGHLKMIEEIVGQSVNGNEIKKILYRFHTTGQAMVTIPMQFDELYVLTSKNTPRGLERSLLVEAQGQYIARSRLKAKGLLNTTEEPDIKKLLKKIGYNSSDKPKLFELEQAMESR